MKTIQRSTEVVSISLSKKTKQQLDQARQKNGQSRSAFIASLINNQTEENRWEKIYKRGEESAKKFKITSEDDIDRLIHAD